MKGTLSDSTARLNKTLSSCASSSSSIGTTADIVLESPSSEYSTPQKYTLNTAVREPRKSGGDRRCVIVSIAIATAAIVLSVIAILYSVSASELEAEELQFRLVEQEKQLESEFCLIKCDSRITIYPMTLLMTS